MCGIAIPSQGDLRVLQLQLFVDLGRVGELTQRLGEVLGQREDDGGRRIPALPLVDRPVDYGGVEVFRTPVGQVECHLGVDPGALHVGRSAHVHGDQFTYRNSDT